MAGLVNRESELERLGELWERRRSALVLLYGRRRVGKTYFLQHFLRGRRGVYFLAAESSSRENLEELLDQVRLAFPARPDVTLANYSTWRTALRLLCELAAGQPLVVVLDEFSYLCHVETALPSIVQAVWDADAQHAQLLLVLCGSEVGMLATLDAYGSALHGRFACVLKYSPLDYYDAARFVLAEGPTGYDARALLQVYGIFGGSGRYLDAIDPGQPLAANVSRLLLRPLGDFHQEGENLIRQEREIRDYANYNAVLGAIASGASELAEITNQAHVEKPLVQHCLDRLQQLAWVVHEKPFAEPGRRGIYRLQDNFLKTWYRYVFKFRSALQIAAPERVWHTLVEPDLPNYMGGQVFEGICAQYLARFATLHELPLILELGRWWSRGGGSMSVELDLVARLADDSYLFAQCKWGRAPIDADELGRLKQKVAVVPQRDWQRSARYAFFSAGGFTTRLQELARESGVLLVGGADLLRDLPIAG